MNSSCYDKRNTKYQFTAHTDKHTRSTSCPPKEKQSGVDPVGNPKNKRNSPCHRESRSAYGTRTIHPSDCWSSPACSSSMRFREFDGSAGPPRHPQQRLKGAWINKSTTCRGDDADLQAAVTKTREKMPLIGADMTLLGLIRARPLIAGRVMRNFGPVDSDISESPIRYSDSKRTPVRHR